MKHSHFWQRLRRFLTPLLGASGLVILFYGIEKIVDQSVLSSHPLYLAAAGVLLLLLTGTFYTKL